MFRRSLNYKLTFLLIIFSLMLGVTIGIVTYSAARESYIELNSEKIKDTVKSIPYILKAEGFSGDVISSYIDKMKNIDVVQSETASDSLDEYYSEINSLVEKNRLKDGQTVIEQKEINLQKYNEILKQDDYKKLVSILNEKKQEFEYSYLYIFIPGEDGFVYLLEADIVNNDSGNVDLESDIAYIGKVYDYEVFEEKYLVPDVEGLITGSLNSTDRAQIGGNSLFGESIQAWTPIFNSDGEFIAMIEADLLLPNILAEIKNNYMSVFVAIVIIIILIAIIQFNATRKLIIKPLYRLNAKMFEYASADELEIVENEIYTGDELQTLSETFCKMAGDIRTYMTNLATVTAEREKAATELNVARHIQESVLPSIFPPFPDRKEFDIFAIMNPAKEVGGDFYDFFMIGEDKVGFLMADVSGKGIPAALFMMISKALIKNLALSDLEVNEIFEKANSQLNENNDTFMFVTAFMGILDLNTGKLSFVNGGHNPPLIKRKDGKFEWLKMEVNTILAVIPDTKFVKQEITLYKGDMLFTYTDGVTEAVNDKYEFYTDPKLEVVLNTIVDNKINDIREIVQGVRLSIDEFANGAEQADDITMLLFKYNQDEE